MGLQGGLFSWNDPLKTLWCQNRFPRATLIRVSLSLFQVWQLKYKEKYSLRWSIKETVKKINIKSKSNTFRELFFPILPLAKKRFNKSFTTVGRTFNIKLEMWVKIFSFFWENHHFYWNISKVDGKSVKNGDNKKMWKSKIKNDACVR